MVDFDARLDDISDEMNVELVRLQRAVERGDEAQASQSLERLNALARDFIAARQKSLDAIGSFAQDVLTRATAFYRQLRKRQGIAPAYPKPPPPPRHRLRLPVGVRPPGRDVRRGVPPAPPRRRRRGRQRPEAARGDGAVQDVPGRAAPVAVARRLNPLPSETPASGAGRDPPRTPHHGRGGRPNGSTRDALRA